MMPREGDTVRVTGVMDDPDPIPVGTRGVVRSVRPAFGDVQIDVDWIGVRRSLMLLGSDPYVVESR
jgi:hypothetical protein